MEDHVRGHAVALRRFRAPCAQALPARALARAHAGRRIDARAAAAGRLPGARRLHVAAQRDLLLALEHRLARFRQHECAEAAVIDGEITERDELPEDRPPFGFGQFGADAERAETLVTALQHLFGTPATQHFDQMARAEIEAARALRAEHARQRHLRLTRRVPCRRRLEAGVAIAARAARLAEVRKEAHPAARCRLAQPEQRVELRRLNALVRVVGIRFVDHLALLNDIAEPIRHPRIRRHAVAARAPGLLVVAFDAFRQIQVRDEAHIRLVDAHAERDRRAHHDPLLALEHLLVLLPDFELHSRVIRQRTHPCAFNHSAVSSTLRRDRQ